MLGLNQTMKQSTVTHEIQPVWNSDSRILFLGTMPSPKSREAGFFYMHPQNRFWKVMSAVFEEPFKYPNNDSNRKAAVSERRNLLLSHNIAIWDVLSSCEITGASDASIKNALPNDFHEIFEKTKIRHVFCTGKTAYELWKKFCAGEYEAHYNLTVECLPSTSPANASWTLEKLTAAYKSTSNFTAI